jgi:hypothetical protein
MAAVQAVFHNKDANRETALKLYTNEVIKAFREKNVAMSTVKVREISGGKTAQFIVTGKADEADIQTHSRGEEVLNRLLDNDEVTITVDTRYVHSHFSDDLDNKLAQYDLRSELSAQSGEVLSIKIDKDIFYGITHDGGTMPPPTNGQWGAATVTVDGYTAATTAEEKGNAIIEALYEARAILNMKDVTGEPSVFVAPQDYYNIVQSTRGVNADWTSNNGGIDTGKVRQIAGFSIGWTNHLDKTDQSANNGIDATDLIALMYTRDVFGVVKAMDIKSEANYDFRRLGWQLTSYYAMGMGPLTPTGLVFLMADATP